MKRIEMDSRPDRKRRSERGGDLSVEDDIFYQQDIVRPPKARAARHRDRDERQNKNHLHADPNRFPDIFEARRRGPSTEAHALRALPVAPPLRTRFAKNAGPRRSEKGAS